MASFDYYCENCIDKEGLGHATGNWAYILWVWIYGKDDRVRCKYCGDFIKILNPKLKAAILETEG